MKQIILTQNKVALVDDEDFEELNKYKWHAHKHNKTGTFYAERKSPTVNGKQKTIHMHRVIINSPKELEIDHIDGDGLNNQKSNLRSCTVSQNKMNMGKQKNNTSEYKGVCWDKSNKKWKSQIKINKKLIYLGLFKDKKKAAECYNNAALKYHGEFAKLNIIKIKQDVV